MGRNASARATLRRSPRPVKSGERERQSSAPSWAARATLKAPVRRPDCIGLYTIDRKSTRLNSSHDQISYAVFCLKKKTTFAHHLPIRFFNGIKNLSIFYPYNPEGIHPGRGKNSHGRRIEDDTKYHPKHNSKKIAH